MRFAFALEPQTLRMPLVPGFAPARVRPLARVSVNRPAQQAAPEPDAPRFPEHLDQLDLDQRVRAMGEW